MPLVYLDNNATTSVAPEVLEAMLPYLRDAYGNPSSMHDFGGHLSKVVDHARGQLAALIGAHPDEIIFTSCGTESDNTAIASALETQPTKRHLVTTKVEHPALISQMNFLQKKGYEVTFVEVRPDGICEPETVRAAIRPDTAIVSVMWANNETGVINPIAEIAAAVKEKGVLFHTDAVQAVGKEPIDLSVTPVDMLSLSGHKLHAPKGIGALFLRRGTPFRPYIMGGHQENGRRGGTYAVPNIVALGAAAELAGAHMAEERRRVTALRDRLEAGLLERIPAVHRLGNPELRLFNTTAVSFEFIEGEAILLLLSENGVCASSGSACSSGSLEPSHVLRAMGLPFELCHASIRFSFSRYNTDADVDRVLEVTPGIIRELRRISPFTPPELLR
ncbi:cysteine desulfurase NifS [Myxococcota bacterium]|nr:cysteine desulfurase NifS [Myxococcota bacterium]MBU1411083.1 cysteine desulfurase NifS [Myxococcota bacterium]MBU1511972.1 cysteine desulfurase NifS [Myxococcota bacterium]PKN21894.1 MAG: cysteine desulfurase NifS [Deltaproteobacteria bacterium HGW-Deltaproteobacteria-22]